jgi:hypothetical protein
MSEVKSKTSPPIDVIKQGFFTESTHPKRNQLKLRILNETGYIYKNFPTSKRKFLGDRLSPVLENFNEAESRRVNDLIGVFRRLDRTAEFDGEEFLTELKKLPEYNNLHDLVLANKLAHFQNLDLFQPELDKFPNRIPWRQLTRMVVRAAKEEMVRRAI